MASALTGVLAFVPSSALAQDGAPVQMSQVEIVAPTATELPQPVVSPLTIDFSDDPVLALARQTADPEAFKAILVAALADSPSDREAIALERVAAARLVEARAGYVPTLDLNLGSFRTIARDFSNDPTNIVERSRASNRSDFTAQMQWSFYDFGAVDEAVQAAEARVRAAGLQRDDASGEIATEVIVAWTQVFAYQSLVELIEGFVAAQDGLRSAVERRIAEGVSPESDLAQVASLRAQGEVQLALARRRLAGAEARFEQLSGFPPPARLKRPPVLEDMRMTRDYAMFVAESTPRVESAEALAEAKREEARSARSRLLPNFSTGVDYGRYGVFEGREDYDLRATVNVRYRLFGGGAEARSRAFAAEADAAVAVADRVREEAARDAAIAWSDVGALEAQIAALDDAYRAARQSRDVVVARFGALRGSLFDVADAQNVYLSAASSYIQALTELDAARYVLLARTGRLLDLLGIAEAEDRP